LVDGVEGLEEEEEEEKTEEGEEVARGLLFEMLFEDAKMFEFGVDDDPNTLEFEEGKTVGLLALENTLVFDPEKILLEVVPVDAFAVEPPIRFH
jgi:hypothetical protein